jgi:restriction system protein
MPMPTHEDAMLPVLQILRGGGQHHRRALADAMADHFSLSAAEREALLPSGKMPVIRSRTGWALSYMKQAGLVRSPKRGWYEITPLGIEALAAAPKRIDNDYLMRFEGFREFRERSKSPTDEGGSPEPKPKEGGDVSPIPPDEALEAAYGRLRTAIEAELLDTVRTVTPGFFEQLVVDLLVRMGYGGNRDEAARAIGKSGDEGIDGVIDEDRLGLDVIYIQAKRWEAAIGRPEIQKFAGALQGQRSNKGIFITTSTFTRDAEDYARRIGSRIVLIDGRRLASLMFEHDVGVTPRRSFTTKVLDSDYFEEA